MIRNLQNILFWTIDRITGSKKKSNYDDIKFIKTNSSSEKAKKRKKEYLNAILAHAIKTVPHYKNNAPDFDTLPVVDKNTIRNSFDNFQSSTYINSKKRTVSTSGSTGTPFKVYHDQNKVIRNTSDNLYFWGENNYNIGDKIFFFRLWNAFEKKKSLAYLAQNMVPIDVFDLTDSFINNLLISIQKSKKNVCLLGYVSAFEKICKYLDKTNPEIKINTVKSIITISEKLNKYTKTSIKKYFGIDAVSRYSNIENGIIAQQPRGKSYFIINEASYYIETLDLHSNEPVPNGTLGRIVITDLFNYCVPMIRYDTGDLGVTDIIDQQKVFTKIEGRKIDSIRNTKGEIISFNLVLMVNNYPELSQCQLIQKSEKGYVLKLNTNNTFTQEKKFIADFKNYLGEDANVKVEYVSEIPLLASGKRRMMVNEMDNY